MDLRKCITTLNGMIDSLYKVEAVGGPLHIVTDDGNIEDHHLVGCYRDIYHSVSDSDYVNRLCLGILHELMLLSEAQRLVWWFTRSMGDYDPIPLIQTMSNGYIEEGWDSLYDARVIARDAKTILWGGHEVWLESYKKAKVSR